MRDTKSFMACWYHKGKSGTFPMFLKQWMSIVKLNDPELIPRPSKIEKENSRNYNISFEDLQKELLFRKSFYNKFNHENIIKH